MTASFLDAGTRHLADRHRSRRRLLRDAGLSAAALTSVGVGSAFGQVATPAADDVHEELKFLFIQSFGQGRIVPNPEHENTFTLLLDLGLDQTLYFSDRPERIVGVIPTARFLETLGFTPANPPNAALVAEVGEQGTQVVVLELMNPRQDPATRTLAYDVRLLSDDERLGMTLPQRPLDSSVLPEQFGPAHLFIDDCPDAKIECWIMEGAPVVPQTYLGDLPPGTAPNGLWHYCFDPIRGCCSPCRWTSAGLVNFCREEFPECNTHICAAVSPIDVTGECGVL